MQFVCKEAAAAPAMVSYLRSTVGIARKDHATLITDHVHFLVTRDDAGENGQLADDPRDGSTLENDTDGSAAKAGRKDRLTFCVEGNISVGKSTFLKRIIGDYIELHDLVELVPEPIQKWQHVGADSYNILEAFYQDPQRYAYTFQNYVFITRMMAERESAGGIRPIRRMERSIFSDRMVSRAAL